VTLPLAGGAYLRFLPDSVFRWGLSQLVDAGEPTVLYLHAWEIDPKQPRQDVGWRVRVNHYHNLGRTESRLHGLLEWLRFAPMGEVLGTLEARGQLPSYALLCRDSASEPDSTTQAVRTGARMAS
jgi:hypothetical protein